MEAALDHVEGSNAILKRRDGREAIVPLAGLSEADRQWITAQKSSAADAGETVDQNPKAAADWPRTVGLKSTPTVETIREDPQKKEFIYESEHYEFVCDSMLGANLVREFSRVFEATWLVNCLLPLDFKPMPEGSRKKFQARIFTHASDYHDTGGPEGSAGVYIQSARALMLPLDSLGVKMFGTRVTVDYKAEDYATLIHEITHQMMNRWLDRLPIWYIEGSAVYVELAKYDNGHFSFLQQDKRLREYLTRRGTDGKFQMVPLQRLMNLSGREWLGAVAQGDAGENYASAVALTYYFYHLDGDGDGAHFKEYIRAVEGLAPGQDDSPLVRKYLLRDRTYEPFSETCRKACAASASPWNFRKASPSSAVLRLPKPFQTAHPAGVKRLFSPLALCAFVILLAGCLATPTSDSGGLGAVTVPNTNVSALISAAQTVFAQYGYSPGPMSYPDSISFDKPAGGFGKLLYGSYGTTTTVRVKLRMAQLTGNDYRLSTRVSRVTNAGEAGFESNRKMIGLWSGEFGPLLQKIKTQASNAGPM